MTRRSNTVMEKLVMVTTEIYRNVSLAVLYVPHLKGGDILILVQILLVLALALESHFLVCTMSCEPVVGFLPNSCGYYNWDITKN